MTINTCGMFIESFTVINVSNNGNTALLSVSIGNDLPGSAIQYCLKDANQNILTNYTEVAITTRVSSSLAYVTINDNNLPNTTYLTLRLYNSCGGCGECSSGWNPADCLQTIINNPCYLYDGKLPPSNPNQVTVKLSKILTLSYNGHTTTLTYDQTVGTWTSQSIPGWTVSIYNGVFTINYQGLISYTISIPIRYRQLYDDYTTVDSFTTSSVPGSAENCSVNSYPTIGCFGASYVTQPCALVDKQGHLWTPNGLSDGSPSYIGPLADFPNPRIYLFKYNGIWYLAANQDPNQALYQQSGASNTPPLSWANGDITFTPLGETVITFADTCRLSLPYASSNCEDCVNTPATLYTVLPKYDNYFSGCTGKPIDIDIDICNGTIRPTAFSKSSFVLYYQGGPNQPFLVVDDNAYDVRGVTGLVKIFETNNAADMRTQVCNRIRFATLLDETLLETNLDSALISDWPYNDLYWYSACDNLPDEVPIDLVPC